MSEEEKTKTPQREQVRADQSSTEEQPGARSDHEKDSALGKMLPGKEKTPFTRRPEGKFFIIGVITVLFGLLSLFIWGLVEDRAKRADKASAQISEGWGGDQALNGPYIVVPYENDGLGEKDAKGKVKRSNPKLAIYSANKIKISGNFDVEERKKSIYSLPVYASEIVISGEFSHLDTQIISADRNGVPNFNNAFLVMGLSDIVGIRSDVEIEINGSKAGKFGSGAGGLVNTGNLTSARSRSSRRGAARQVTNAGGIQFPLSSIQAQGGFKFQFKFNLNGSRVFQVIPSGQLTEISLKSNWPHPGFGGRFLPEKREISKEGFSANWTIPGIALGISPARLGIGLNSGSPSIEVNFVEPLNFYQIVTRTVKYAIGFIGLIFLVVFVLEMQSVKSFHWIQYILTGIAILVFYIMLLALAEQVGFTLAYLLAAAATVTLIAWYVGDALKRKNGSLVVGICLTIVYAIIYFLVNEDEYALLAGAVVGFIAIAGAMYATRSIDWSGDQKSGELADNN